jgi:hypothetical protein
MRFNDLIAHVRTLDLGEPGDETRPPRDNVRSVQNALAAGLMAEEFSLDCIERELESALGARQTPGAPFNAPPFAALPRRGIFFRLFYWPPGKVAPAHEHASWTTTAVFHGELTVTTYDWETAVRERRLEKKNVFSAERGRAGHIYESCIHAPSNPTPRLATSIHVFNSNDKPTLAGLCGPIEGLAADMTPRPWPVEPDAFARAVGAWRRALLLMHADMLARFRSERARGLLDRIYERGDLFVKFVVSRIMEPIDSLRSSTMLEEVVSVAPEFRERAALVTLRS